MTLDWFGIGISFGVVESLPPPPGVKPSIGPENEHGPEDRHDPAMPGIAGKRERLALRSLDQRVEEAAHDGPDNAQRHRQDQAHALPPWDQEARNQAHDQATQDPAEKGTDAHLPHSYYEEERPGSFRGILFR
jgi:hypothetical protein